MATGAGGLPARYVFHAVGPVYRDGAHGEPELLASCYRSCFALAGERGVKTISFPAISTGVYGYPMEAAAAIAVREAVSQLARADSVVERVVFVLFGRHAYEAFRAALESQSGAR